MGQKCGQAERARMDKDMQRYAWYFSRLLLSDCTVGSGPSPEHATSSGVRALPPIGNWEGVLRLPSPCPEDCILFYSRRRERGRWCDEGRCSRKEPRLQRLILLALPHDVSDFAILIVEGILWKIQTGSSWREMPERFGPWSTVSSRYRLWRKEGRWTPILRVLQTSEELFLSSA